MNNNKYDIFLNINQKYIPMINDMLRMFTIQLVTQILISLTNPSIKLFNTVFIKTTSFILFGVMVYWAVIKELFTIKTYNSEGDIDYAYVYSI
tara:strand:+ start:1766 stop:2044 length:279 start_codon:yes stop_codon:yes gene_type:complete